ncbi:pentatricopeptide repeat-containing protein [Tanacetum coccineum]
MLSGLDQQMEKKEDGGMYFTDRILVPLVGDVRKMIMDEVHTMKYLIHPGADKMYHDLRDMYWWSCIERDVATYERLKEARDCQKSYADNWRKLLEFEVGDRVLLKMSPWKGTVRFRKKGKLALRYVGPFEILERIGEHSEVKEVKMRVVKLKDHIWALFFCIPELDLETGGLKIIKNDADVHALYDLAKKQVSLLKSRPFINDMKGKVIFTEMYCHEDEGFEHCPPLNDDEVGKDYLVPRSCDFDNKCMNNASKILESMNNNVEGIIQSVEGIIQSVEGMNDATNCVSIDEEVLARQNKLDKGKRPMTYDGIVTSKKRKNVHRGNDVSIRENDNHVLSNSESESEDNVDEYAHMYFNSESDESDKSFVCLSNGEDEVIELTKIRIQFKNIADEVDDKEGPTKAEEDTCNDVDIADVDDNDVGLTLLVRKHEKYIKALFNEIKRNAKNFALNEGDVAFQDHYGYLRSYAKALADSNEVSTVKVGVTVNPDEKTYFDRFYVCFKGLKEGWKMGCQRIIALDVEDQENWSWFLDLVADDLKLPNGNGLTIMSDQHNVKVNVAKNRPMQPCNRRFQATQPYTLGLIEAVKEVMPLSKHQQCARYIYEEFRKQFSRVAFKRLFGAASKASYPQLFNKIMKNIKRANPRAHWYREYDLAHLKLDFEFSIYKVCISVDTAYPRNTAYCLLSWIRRIGSCFLRGLWSGVGVDTAYPRHRYVVSSLMDTAYWSSEQEACPTRASVLFVNHFRLCSGGSVKKKSGYVKSIPEGHGGHENKLKRKIMAREASKEQSKKTDDPKPNPKTLVKTKIG